MNSGADIDSWLTADNGQPCTVIGGALTIQQWNIKATDLAKMLPLVAVCGSVTIQQLSTGTLHGLDNLAYIGGSFFLAQNSRPWASGGEVNDISALSSLQYVGGAMSVTENLYLTESDIKTGFSSLKVAGAVNIEFYESPGLAKAGSMKECKVKDSDAIVGQNVEGTISMSIDSQAEITKAEFETGIKNGIAVIASVSADQVTISISPNTRRLRSSEWHGAGNRVHVDYVIMMPALTSSTAIATSMQAASPSALTASISQALVAVGITQAVSVTSLTARVSSTTTLGRTTTSTGLALESPPDSIAGSRASQSMVACIVCIASFLIECSPWLLPML
jgi:hypothetical protein